jgi:hypothetical protein
MPAQISIDPPFLDHLEAKLQEQLIHENLLA